ncbi:LYR motif-containing protein 4B [Anabrus simplex]|uniref:LYR motif-containing protein 4B n=1 Tax=Anabrus simplex TaxID=316456 RepID=UPI0034DCCD11
MAASKSVVLQLYKAMLKEALQFPGYNFRMYALRRIRDSFRQNMSETDQSKVKLLIQYGEENLSIMRRQTVIGKLYSAEKLVIEKKHKQDPRERAVAYKSVNRN